MTPSDSPQPRPDLGLAWRAEQAGLNASAPPQQSQVDGWLLRLSPGKAKRSRCVNALAEGHLPLPELLARCQQAFTAAGLPLLLRITPFSQPADLEARLAALGWPKVDEAMVMVRATLDDLPEPSPRPDDAPLQPVDAQRYAQGVGELRGSSPTEIAAHAERLEAATVRYQGFWLRASSPEHPALRSCGQIALEGDLVGLYDIATPAALQGQGHASQLCLALLHEARRQGARQAYLQVDPNNAPALAIYQRLGFVEAYRYHFRQAP